MKNLSTLLLLTGFFVSGCMKTSTMEDKPCAVKWQLVEMTGNMADVAPLHGEDMSWQESYTLRPDSTFTKNRTSDKVLQASGRYTLVNMDGEQYIEFNFDSAHEIVGSCYGDAKETLRLADGKLVGTWQACDGPGLTYERVVVNCGE